MNNSDLQFVTKTSGGVRTQNEVDVSLTLVQDRQCAALSFSRKAIAMMGSKEYFVVARKGSRVFFMPAVATQGFKLGGRPADCTRRMIRIPAHPLGINGDWVGYYGLFWDKERELFYIDVDLRQGA